MSHARIESYLTRTIGLQPESIGHSAIERAVTERLAACGMDAQAYWQHLQDSGREAQCLIEAVVVPETWFFRDRRAFQALTEEILPASPWREGVPCRLLSAPCATGEEPYSLAMTLLDSGWSPRAFRIDAWDISERALAGAERAIYGKNSFRGTDLRYRDRHFEKSGSDYRLNESVRHTVRFHHANLLQPNTPSDGGLYDVIFCRNLLIYFDRESQQRAVRALARLLTPKGALIVSPSEVAPLIANGFESCRIPNAFAFRRAQEKPPIRVASGLKRAATVALGGNRPTVARSLRALEPATAPDSANLAPEPVTDVSWVEAAMRLADAGKLTEAMALCDRALRHQPTSAQAYYLKGVLHDALDRADEAVTHYRKALYLDPQHRDALLHLGATLLKSGDRDGAQPLFARAARLAGTSDD